VQPNNACTRPAPSALRQIAAFLDLLGAILQFGVTANPARTGDAHRYVPRNQGCKL